jgi:hypothetical protein
VGAYQFGERKNDSLFPNSEGDLSAWGLNSRLTYLFKDPCNNQLYVGYEYLSGDDPGSSTNEQFDPLWGRWPQWSELYIYTYAVETRIAETTNLHRLNLGWLANPVKNMETSFNYHLLFTAENTKAGVPGFSRSGDLRGHLFTAILMYKFNRFLAGHLWGEYFVPGGYYEEGAGPFVSREDPELFLRWEFMLTF